MHNLSARSCMATTEKQHTPPMPPMPCPARAHANSAVPVPTHMSLCLQHNATRTGQPRPPGVSVGQQQHRRRDRGQRLHLCRWKRLRGVGPLRTQSVSGRTTLHHVSSVPQTTKNCVFMHNAAAAALYVQYPVRDKAPHMSQFTKHSFLYKSSPQSEVFAPDFGRTQGHLTKTLQGQAPWRAPPTYLS